MRIVRSFLFQLCAVLAIALSVGARPASANYIVYLFDLQMGPDFETTAVHTDTYTTDETPTNDNVRWHIEYDNVPAQAYVAVEYDANGQNISIDSGIVYDLDGNPTVDRYRHEGIVFTETRCSGDSKFKADLLLGSAEPAPFFQGNQPHGLMGELRLTLKEPSFKAFCNVRNAFYNGGYLWNKSRIEAGVSVPLCSNTDLFVNYERAYRTGDEWGWAGLRFHLF